MNATIIRNRRHDDRVLVVFPDVPAWMVIEESWESSLQAVLAADTRASVDNDPQSVQLAEAIATLLTPVGEQVVPAKRYSRAVLDVTRACSLSCVHCSHQAKKVSSRANSFMDLSIVDKVVGDLESARASEGWEPDAEHLIHLVGGEPLLHPNLEEIFDRIGMAGFVPTVICNLTDISGCREFLENLPKKKYRWEFSVSLDGFDDATNSPTRGRGSYARTVKNLAFLREMGIPFSLNPLIHADNRQHLERILDTFVEYGACEINVLALRSVGRAAVGKKSIRKVEQSEVYADLVSICARRHDLRSYLQNTRFWYFVTGLLAGRTKKSCGLHAPSTAYVTENADVYMCGYMLVEAGKIGTVGEKFIGHMLKDAKNNVIAQASLIENTDCRDCHLRNYCAGGCRAEHLALGGIVHERHLECQNLTDALHHLMFTVASYPDVADWMGDDSAKAAMR